MPWPKDLSYPDFIRTLDPTDPHHAALLSEAAGLIRGSGYTSFDGDAPEDPIHAALASTYAHTTAPLRRLVDRYVGEACVALSAGEEIPEWVRAELPTLPEVMEESSRRASQYEAGIVSALEAALFEEQRRRDVRRGRRRGRRARRRRGRAARPSRRSPRAATATTCRSASGSRCASSAPTCCSARCASRCAP